MLWHIYENSPELPGYFVAREIRDGERSGSTIQARDLEIVRDVLREMKCTILEKGDDPEIIESWGR